tara:strand:+ start:222 stop:413 length:192 start_codon:yes stop_codon:yes gene_type:complete
MVDIFMSLREHFPPAYIIPAIFFLSLFFYTMNNWGIPWRLSFLIGAVGWFAGIMLQTAAKGTW